MTDLLTALDVAAVAVICGLTVYLMQSLLTESHILLRLALAMVAAGAVLDLYCRSAHPHILYGNDPLNSVLANIGHACVYIWLAVSRPLRDILTADRIQRSLRKPKADHWEHTL